MKLAVMNKTKMIFCTLIIALLSVSAFGQAGLTLGGKFVPRDSIYLYLFLGNSVMSGRDTPPDTITDSHAWKYVMTNNCYAYLKTCPPQYSWQRAEDPICFDSKNPSGTLVKSSPGMPFLKRMVKDYPGYHFGIAQLSGSAWQLTHYMPPNAGDIKAFVTQGNLLKQNCHIAGVVMMFNIVEIQYCNGDSNYVNIQNYARNIDSIMTFLRNSLGMPALPLIISDYPVMAGDPKDPVNDDYNITGHWSAPIKALMNQTKLASQRISATSLIPTDSLPVYGADGLYTHYSTRGHYLWGNRVADTICARNWGPINKCGVTVAVSALRTQAVSRFSPLSHTVFFDGHNWNAFDKSGRSFEMFLPNGKVVNTMTSTRLRNEKLRPGVYITRAIVEK